MIGVGDWVASKQVVQNVMDVLRSGRISYGPYSRQFEEEVADLHTCSFGVLSNSGTSSLLVALQALKTVHGWADGDEVLVPASTFVATYNIVLQNKLTPVLVDVDPCHYLVDVEKARAAITSKTRAIIPVHLFGQPVDVRSLAFYFGLKVLEDSCECIGLKGIAYGDITCFSFYMAHILTTGVGGMAITDDPEYATTMRSLVNHGRDNIYISIDDGRDRLAEVIGKRFSFQYVGHSFRITELESAIGVAQLPDLRDWMTARRANALFLLGALEGSCYTGDRLQLPGERLKGQHAWMMFPLVCDNEDDKKRLCLALESAGIETRDALPLVTQPVYGIKNPQKLYPNAYRLATCGFYVGCHQYLTMKDMIKIAEFIRGYYASQ